MEKKLRNWMIGIIFILAVLMIISILIPIFSNLSYLASFRIVFGSLYVLFIPGFIISFIFFPRTKEFDEKNEDKEKNSIDWIERIALSFALSIAIVPLAVFYLNLLSIKINILNSFLIILAIILVSSIILILRSRK